MRITKHFTFEASHVLPLHKGKCARLHGHSWKMAVTAEGPISEKSGFVCDFGSLKELVDQEVIKLLDHSHLGQGQAATGVGYIWHPYLGPDFYPSSENLCRAIFKLLKPLVQELGKDIHLVSVRIAETCTSEAEWREEDES